jgi:Arc/MetJ-type ribon-helix-helix transcriptional regulator
LSGEEKVQVSISKNLYERVKRYIEETGGFNSVDEFVEFVVEQALESVGEGLTEEDKKKVEERLKDLGYM